MSTRTSSNHTAAAALVYWLMVMCGLAGLSVLRMNTPREFVPLWIGSVAGIGLGQTLAWLRLRAWLIAVMSIVAIAALPVVFAILYMVFGSLDVGLDGCVLAFVPAAVCGYLSLSERAGLIAFWYPAMLWMVVILDRPGAAAFDMHTVLPLVAGLGGLFVVFLRSRETRRTAIWGAHSTLRLAEPLSRTVLRTSPLRGASQHLWTGAVGVGSLLLAAWVAPHLWQREAAHPHAAAIVPQPSTEELLNTSAPLDPNGDQCCTNEDVEEQRRERVREYLPVSNSTLIQAHSAARPPCTRCQSGKHARDAASGAKGIRSGTASRGYGKDGSSTGNYWSGDTTPAPMAAGTYGPTGDANDGATGYGTGYGTVPSYVAPEPPVADPIPEVKPLPPVPPLPKVAKLAAVPSKVDVVATKPEAKLDTEPPSAGAPSHATAPKPTVVFLPQQPVAPPANGGMPWRSALALCLGGIALHLAMRAMRRQLTLRHLARPFWRETLDQRVSNQWQRMLIGLRDAGIHPSDDEQPQALAKRVGIEGMAACATILERVRHGIRVGADDLAVMDAASTAVYRAARAKAGAAARAAALVRSPL